MSIRVALFGTKFMGKAHSQAYRNVNMYFDDAPEVEMKVIVGRNPDETEEARKAYGWEEASTDWKATMAREDIDVVDVSTPVERCFNERVVHHDRGHHRLGGDLTRCLADGLLDGEALPP